MATSELTERGTQALKAGNYDEARKLFRAHEEKAGTTKQTQALLAEADAKLAAGAVQDAAALFDQVLERNPTLTEVYLGLARLALFTNQLDAATVHATAATRLGPQVGLAWTLMGLVQEARGDAKNGLVDLKKGAELGPKTYLCQLNYGRVLAALDRAAEALAPLTKATGLEPKAADGFYFLGMALKKAGQLEKALAAFEKAKDLAPKNVDTWATLADVLFEAKAYPAARGLLDDALKTVGDHPALLEKALATAMLQGDLDGALAYVQRELKVVPDFEQGWLNLAGLQLAKKDAASAEKTVRALLERQPKSGAGWTLLGDLLAAAPKEKEAVEAYKKAVALAPGDWKLLMNFGSLYVEAQSLPHQEAVPLLEQAVAKAPKGEFRPLYNLALAFVRTGKKDKALELARRIQKEAPATDKMAAEAKKLESNLKEAKA